MTDHGHLYTRPVDGGEWTYLGKTDGPIRLEMEPAISVTEVTREALRLPGPITFTINDPSPDLVAALYRMIHDIDRMYRPRKHSHCQTCHPEMAPRPLAVDGREYHRRRKARLRRKNR